jgi:hypothetical protein
MPLAGEVFGDSGGLGGAQMMILSIIGTIVALFVVLFCLMAWFGL